MFLQKLLKLAKLLLPTGRAWRLFENNVHGSIQKGLALSNNRFIEDAMGLLDGILPDNFNFTTNDAEKWEARLGLPINPNVTLQDRKLAIQRKLNHPGDTPGRHSRLFFQQQLQDAGFTNLVVTQNKFNGVAKAPEEMIGTKHGDAVHGDAVHGGYLGGVVIDYLEPSIDEQRYLDYIYAQPSNKDLEPFYRKTFFISAENLEYATVDANRRRELRGLILRLMPASMICFLIVKYQ
jgi:uncharacterized protein YmfQ (DUF2313 family)